MGPAGVNAWQRFFDHVVTKGADWPQDLWFAAVEDGLAATLGAQATLVEAFRRDAAELLALDRAGGNSWHDEQRIAQLEAQIQATLRQADESVRGPAPESRRGSRPKGSASALGQPFWPQTLRVFSFALLLLGTGLLGGVHLYDARLAHQVGQEVGRHVAGLLESIALSEKNVATGMAAFEQESERVARLQAELAAGTDALTGQITQSLQAMLTLRETALAELNAELAKETGVVAEMIGRLQERGAALNRGLDEVSGDLAALEQRLPGVSQSFAALDERLEEGQTELAETVDRVRALQSTVPDLLKWVDTESAGFESAFDDKRQVLAALDGQLADLSGGLGASGERLAAFDRTVEQQLEQAKDDRARLDRMMEELHAGSDAVATLVAGAEAELEAARVQTQDRIDAMLTEVAEKADLAVMRADDVLKRGQAEAMRRVEAASLEATRAFDRLRAEEIAGLTEQIAATRTELEQTRAGLVASWQRMDRFVAERHNQLLSELDRYAQTMEARVQQLLEALNVMVAQGEEKKS